MVRKVFWDDPYLSELQTEVTRVIGDQVTLRETVFFAQSGGQESNKGSISVFPVLNARWDGNDICYTLPPDHDLRAGNVVTVMIDWPRRYKLMRLHFAAEVVLELVCSELKKPKKIGAHIAEDKARIDFDFKENIDKYLDKIALMANIVVANN
jgi:Ser-tRNA(Ala) deacylase AlaX